MASPRFEVPAGVIDGVNTVFTVSRPYIPGSTAVFRNGILQERSLDDGWYETNPVSGIITMKEPPSSTGFDDIIQIFFLEASPFPLPETVLFKFKGIVNHKNNIRAKISQKATIRGYLAPSQPYWKLPRLKY